MLTRVFRAHYSAVLAYVVRRTHQRTLAQDIAASTFATAAAKIDIVPEGPEARRWLIAVARRHLSNHWRSARRSRSATRAIVCNLAGTHEEHADLDRLNSMMQCFRRLRASDQAALRLVYWDGLRHDQAAAVAGCSVGAFDSRVSRARRDLRRLLAEKMTGLETLRK